MKSIKYFFDYITAILLILILSPVFIIISIMIMLQNDGPILFSQNRPGLKGKVFKIYKFRTMLNLYDSNNQLLPDHMRMTKFGTFIRSLSLDELPQLINILKGELSLVGPRPLLVEYLNLYSQEELRRHNVKPGITGWAQINGRNSISWKKKFELDLWYVDNWSLFLDFKILLHTAYKVIKRSDIQQSENTTMPPYDGTN